MRLSTLEILCSLLAESLPNLLECLNTILIVYLAWNLLDLIRMDDKGMIIYILQVDYQLFVHQLLLITHICVLYVQVNISDILRKRKACCKKNIDHSKDFPNLTVVANV